MFRFTWGRSVLAAAHLQIHDYLGDAAKNSDEIENIPSVSKVVLEVRKQKSKQNMEPFGRDRTLESGDVFNTRQEAERQDLQDTLQGEEDGEGRVQVFQDGVVCCRC